MLGLTIFGSTYAWYLSLTGTSVAGNSAVYQSAPVFVFLLSIFVLKEKVTAWKLIAVVLCVSGSAVVAVISSEESNLAPNEFWLNSTITQGSLGSSIIGIGPTAATASCAPSVLARCKNNCTGGCNAVTCSVVAAPGNLSLANCTKFACQRPCEVTRDNGTTVEVFGKEEAAADTVVGYGWCLASVILYAAYEVRPTRMF